MVPSSTGYTPVSALISVDFPAPFSPMSACTSPPRRTRFTASSARTAGKRMVMSRIATSGGASRSAGIRTHPWLRERCPAGEAEPGGAARVDCDRERGGSVGTLVDDLGRLLLGEALVLDEVRLVDLFTVEHLLHQVGSLLA